MRGHASTLVTLSLLIVATGAGAQQQPPPPNIELLQDVAQALRVQNRPDVALRILQVAYGLSQEPRTQVRIGLAELAMGRFVDAEEHLTAALQASGNRWIADNTANVEAARDQARRELGTLEVHCNVPGAELWVNDERYRTLSFQGGSQRVRIQRGSWRVEVRAEGYIARHWAVEVPVGEEVGARIHATLVRTPPRVDPDAPRASGTSAGPYVLMGVGGAGVAAFVLFQFALREAAWSRYQAACPGDICSPASHPVGLEAVSDANAWGVAGGVSLGVGVAGLVGGFAWWLGSRPSAEPATPRSALLVAPTVHSGGGGLRLLGAF